MWGGVGACGRGAAWAHCVVRRRQGERVRGRVAGASILESIAKLYVHLPRVVPVKTAEGLAVVEFNSAVGHVEGVQRRGQALTEVLSKREIERGVLRQVVSRIRLSGKGIAEARAVVDVNGSKRTPRKGSVAAKIQSISLIMIEWEEVARRRDIRQAACDR